MSEFQDDIFIFLPGISQEEYQLRARLRTARNISTKAMLEVAGTQAHTIYCLVNELVTDWIYSPANIGQLSRLVEQCRRLVICAQHFEKPLWPPTQGNSHG